MEIWKLFGDLVKHSGYNAVLAALMSAWQLDPAVRLLHDLPSRQIDPDTTSYNTVMATLAKQPILGPVAFVAF